MRITSDWEPGLLGPSVLPLTFFFLLPKGKVSICSSTISVLNENKAIRLKATLAGIC